MKKTRKILYSVLIILTIVTLFLPVAVSVDNRLEEVEAQIRKEEGGMTRSVDKLTRENDKVTKAAKDAVVVTEEDEALLAEIETAEKQIADIESQIQQQEASLTSKYGDAIVAMDDFLAAAADVERYPELTAAVEKVTARKEALQREWDAEKETLQPEYAKLEEAKTAKAELDKQYAEIQKQRDFIQQVELEDENGKLIALKDVLQAELDANPDVFASRSETEVSEFMKWKETLDAKRVELDTDKEGSKLYDENGKLRAEFAAEDAVLTEDEQYLVTSLQDSDERYTVMIMIVREQVAVNAMAADPAADQTVLKNLQKALDGVYKQIGKVNEEQENVDAVRIAGEEMMAADPIEPVNISMLPSRLPVTDNYTGEINEQIDEWEKKIGSLNNEIAELAELLANDAEMVEAYKKTAEEKLVVLTQELEERTAKLVEAEAALAAYEATKVAATADETNAMATIAANADTIVQLNSDAEKLYNLIAAAENVLKKDAEVAVAVEAALANANENKAALDAQVAFVEGENADLDANLADYRAREAVYADGLALWTVPVEEAQKLVDDKLAEVEETTAAATAASKLLAEITGDKLIANQEKKADLEEELADAEAELAYQEANLSTHKMFLNLPSNPVKVDMQVVNTGGALFPTTFGDFTVAAWIALLMLIIALVLVWMPGDALVSKAYTFASFANLAAVVVLAYALLRLMAIPVAQPYSNPIIRSYVAIPMLVLPIAALLLHSSSVTNTKRTMIYVLCIALCVLSLLPFWLMIVNATRNSQQIQSGVSLIPSTFLKNNWHILQAKHFDVLLGFKNSAIIAFGSTLLGVYFSALTAYGLTVYRFKGAKFLYAVILAIIMIPGQVTGTGFFMFMYQLEWTNSFLPLIIPAIASASTVFFFKQYLEANFQVSLVEAARIDGAGEFFTYNRIVLPIMVPAMATMGIMAVIGSWNNYLTPLMLLSKSEMKTLPMMVKELRGDIYRTEYGSIYLGLTLTAMPLLIVYFLFSKYIIAGVAVGGVKE